MPSKRKKPKRHNRPTGTRKYRKLFILSCEGCKTEPQYFAILNNKNFTIKIVSDNKHNSSPDKVLDRMKKYLQEQGFKKSDRTWEAWLIVDKDNWTDKQLDKLHQWASQSTNYGFALSNPNFEFWLLLHFEDGKNISNPESCCKTLKKYVPKYNKNIAQGQITDKRINHAISRAKKLDSTPCKKWPTTKGSTVYKLVENIINHKP